MKSVITTVAVALTLTLATSVFASTPNRGAQIARGFKSGQHAAYAFTGETRVHHLAPVVARASIQSELAQGRGAF